jgi:hypothetical protein
LGGLADETTVPLRIVSLKQHRPEAKGCRTDSSGHAPPAWHGWAEVAGLTALCGLTFFFLATSWRKWPHPLIDFGRELYVPWRLATGALLYRDVEDIYGPFSQYLNAAFFRLFGPGLMVLVTVNLAVFAAILMLIYSLFRRAWGVGAALASAAVFVSVFAFSEYGFPNFNYATPYAHETTHGMLVCLLLVFVLIRWIQNATVGLSLLAGGLLGLTAVIKPEFMLAGGLVTLAAGFARWRHQGGPKPGLVAAWVGGAILPTLGFAAYFKSSLSWNEALAAACRAWLNVTGHLSSEGYNLWTLGLDRPGEHFLVHASATLMACALIAAIVGGAWLVEWCGRTWLQFVIGGLLAGGLGCLASFEIAWIGDAGRIDAGRCLPGLALIYACICAKSFFSKPESEADHRARITRSLVSLLALALVARMALNGRIYHYGFYQAALTGLLVPAVLIGELPARLKVGGRGRMVIVTAALALVAPGVVILASQSQSTLSWHTYAVGDGVDRFYCNPPEVDPKITGEIVRLFSEELRKTPPDQTLLVLPEGVMLNYLTRKPSPLAPVSLYAAYMGSGREDQMVEELRRHPPEWVAIISRGLREFGLKRYGEKPGSGQQILRWVAGNYEVALFVGGDPLDDQQRGGLLLKHKADIK